MLSGGRRGQLVAGSRGSGAGARGRTAAAAAPGGARSRYGGTLADRCCNRLAGG